MYSVIPASSRLCFLKYINLTYLLMPGKALLYENWGGSYFITDIYTSTTILALVLAPVLAAANYLLYIFKGESRRNRLIQRFQEFFQKILAKMNSLFLELHKLLFLQFGIIIIAVFVIMVQDIKIMRGVNPAGYNYYLDTFYSRFSGVAPGTETDAYIEALKAEEQERQNEKHSGQILSKLQDAISTLEFQNDYLLQVRNEKGMDARFLDMNVYNDIFGERLYKNQENINLLCIVAVILCIGGCFAYERRFNTVSLFNACKNRARVTINKTVVMAFIVFAIWALSFAFNWINILDVYTLKDAQLPIQSLYQFKDFGLNVNIWGYIVFCQMLRLVWLLLIGALALVISVYFDYAASIFTSLILLLPHLLYILKFEALKAVSPVILLDYTRISCEENSNSVLNITYFIFGALVIFEVCLVRKRHKQSYSKLW